MSVNQAQKNLLMHICRSLALGFLSLKQRSQQNVDKALDTRLFANLVLQGTEIITAMDANAATVDNPDLRSNLHKKLFLQLDISPPERTLILRAISALAHTNIPQLFEDQISIGLSALMDARKTYDRDLLRPFLAFAADGIANAVCQKSTPEESRELDINQNKIISIHVPWQRRRDPALRDEIRSAGFVRLFEAKQSFDPTLGVLYLAYLRQRIYWGMIDYLRMCEIIRISPSVWNELQKLDAAQQQLRIDDKHSNDKLLAEQLGWSETKIRQLKNLKISQTNLANEFQESDEGQQLENLVIDHESPEKAEQRRQIAVIVNTCLMALPPRERLIVQARHLQDLTLESLAKSFDVSIERIRQLQKSAEKKMHTCIQAAMQSEQVE